MLCILRVSRLFFRLGFGVVLSFAYGDLEAGVRSLRAFGGSIFYFLGFLLCFRAFGGSIFSFLGFLLCFRSLAPDLEVDIISFAFLWRLGFYYYDLEVGYPLLFLSFFYFRLSLFFCGFGLYGMQ